MRSALILVVEDHPINRRMLQAQLAAEGWQSELVATGADALLWLTHTRPLAVITDYVLEDMTGVELLQRVRRWEADTSALPPIPMILYSGMSLEYLQRESRGLDCTAILTKPISRAQLRQTLAPVVPQEPVSTSSSAPDDLLTDFLQFAYLQLASLESSIKNRRWEETATIAHGLRGAAAENQSRNNASELTEEAYGRLQNALDKLALQLKASHAASLPRSL
jgi:CheY-like chemotaxis protein